ncbi:hypothetical protein C1752_03468 [Acaryochloris thomasi RCC1774]|uniref:Sucrase ferredoxin n=1 Tax=Acaryochloris thomasi RCC1774 TaxID=1764569 RepID=A0A2W1JP31_9CYAN|nr:sucrase ferredoxin [Acaryochloris thomasi]PZD72632.1 hypothetical protein C1752_03468 [Acaryochloris thomasi RCC1774]
MGTTELFNDCRYCSLVSKANGEDPIGTAGTADHWLVMEIPQPWPREMFATHPLISQLLPLLKKLILRHGIKLRPVAISSDPEYSCPGYTRIIYYRRPQTYFAQYEKQDYLVPDSETPHLAIALLDHLMGKANTLPEFDQYLQPTQHLRDILICTHTQVDLACGRFGTPLYRKLRQNFANSESLRVWKSTHFGGHKFAPTLLDLPTGQLWGHLEDEILPSLIHREGPIHNMRPFYRGWSGLGKFEQIAEREVWMQEGWQWLTYPRTGRLQRKGLPGIKRPLYSLLRYLPIQLLQMWLEKWTDDAKWADVKIQYQDADGIERQYRVRVEEYGTVLTASKSAKERNVQIEMIPVPQYRVCELVKQN